MPTIANISWPAMNIEYGFRFKISSIIELENWWNDNRSNQLREGFANYINSREYAETTGNPSITFHHVCSKDGALLAQLCQGESCRETPRSVVEVFCDMYNSIFQGMTRAIIEMGAIYVAENGSYFTLGSGMVESNITEIDEFIMPGAKIAIKKWPNGIHYYAYVGGISVVVNGENKWDTADEARNAAKNWAEEHNIRVED